MNKQLIPIITASVLVLTTFTHGALAGSAHSAKPSIFIDKYDANNDAKVTKREFKKARKATFKLTDENHNGTVDESEYVQEYANRLDKKIALERKAHIKQTHVRFESLDKDENLRIEWAEYQASGGRSFTRYDTNADKVINADDTKPSKWEREPNGVKNNTPEKPELSKEKRKELRKKYAKRVIHMPTTHNKKGMLRKYDADDNGSISYAEFTTKRQADFNRSDENKNGWLNSDEYLLDYTNRLDTSIETMRKKQLKQAGVRFGVLDANDNAAMTFKEYQLSGMKRFKRNDTNDDGVISASDPAPKHSHHHHDSQKNCGGKTKTKSDSAAY